MEPREREGASKWTGPKPCLWALVSGLHHHMISPHHGQGIKQTMLTLTLRLSVGSVWDGFYQYVEREESRKENGSKGKLFIVGI